MMTFYDENTASARAAVEEAGRKFSHLLLDLNLLKLDEIEMQTLAICFAMAKAQGLVITDFTDLRAVIGYAVGHADEIAARHGALPNNTTIRSLQRKSLLLEYTAYQRGTEER
jgi:hypothetical protein